ncbi:MAG TPA: serine hydrolase [Anaerolineae bacterium]|nr:serine hydrolase [Anaerolineae bacterium]
MKKDNKNNHWQHVPPESQNLKGRHLRNAFDYLITAFPSFLRLIIMRNNNIVLNEHNPKPKLDLRTSLLKPYARFTLPLTPHMKYSLLDHVHGLKNVRSVTKSIVSSLVGIAIKQEAIRSVSQNISKFFPQISNNGSKSKITIHHLLSMTSGIPSIDNYSRMKKYLGKKHWNEYILHVPLESEPGQQFIYSSANYHLLTYIVAQAAGKNTLDFAWEYLFNPLGITDFFWECDPDGTPFGGSNLFLNPQDMLKFGLLNLNQGIWQDKQIIPASWISRAIQPHVKVSEEDQYGYGWWLNHKSSADENVSTFIYSACGVGGQRIIIIPGYQIVVVVTCLTSLYVDSSIVDSIIPKFILPAIMDSMKIDTI